MFSSFGCSRILHSLSLSLSLSLRFASLRFAQLCFARALALLVPRSRLCSSRASSLASSLLVPRLSSLPGSTPLIIGVAAVEPTRGHPVLRVAQVYESSRNSLAGTWCSRQDLSS